MPTPIEAFAQVAARHGGIDPNDQDAVQRWYTEVLPTLAPEQLAALLDELLEQDGETSEVPPGTPPDRSYPRDAPLPRLDDTPPSPVPLLAAGWKRLFERLLGRAARSKR